MPSRCVLVYGGVTTAGLIADLGPVKCAAEKMKAQNAKYKPSLLPVVEPCLFQDFRQSTISHDDIRESRSNLVSVSHGQVCSGKYDYLRLCSLAGFVLICTVLSTSSNPALAGPGPCVEDPGNPSIINCNGDQSGGVYYPAYETVTTLNVDSATRVEPASGQPGILLENSGTAPAPNPDSVLGIPIPGDGSGGSVVVNSTSDITTTGTSASGITVQSSTSGYPASVTTDLMNFTEDNIAFSVVSVDNASGNVGQQVAGVLIGADGIPVTDADDNELDGGLFTINADGSFDFDFGTAFDDLAPGIEKTTRVNYEVEMTSMTSGDSIDSEGFLYVTVTREEVLDADGMPVLDDDGNPVTQLVIVHTVEDPDTHEIGEGEDRIEAVFAEFGGSAKPTDEQNPTVFPDLKGYADRLLADASEGGAGNSVSVESTGVIETSGDESHGIYAKSQGANGGNGANAGWGFLCIGSAPSRPGGTGKRGGNVTATVDGSISTSGERTTGITALSRAGNGGKGGNGTPCRYGAAGGTGGNGGNVEVSGSARIDTASAFNSGVLAFSEGGNGGNAGDGSWWNGAGGGGSGGQGGSVVVDGSWTITTQGDKAHGIWAKSLGGNAGAGGSGGWLGGSPGGGGLATDGGSVTVTSNGSIETFGEDAFGIYAQSVGGFGGKGGDAYGIFYSSGGDGNSAGSGGDVNVTNTSNGTITTHGLRAHAIYAQSIGGGGGSGGGAGAIVSVGGTGAAGGEGGTVTVTNDGEIETGGENARGIYAQSVGGGGGDGGDSGGLVAIGGKASGTSDGGTVTVTNNGSITTQGVRSGAIFAESVGGGGGDGGSSGGWFSIGGSGGGGGDADDVSVTNTGLLQTTGADSSAIFAQSVGGGGGNGGGSVSVGAFVSLAIGGNGGKGGDAGEDVKVINAGIINTAGERSHGIHAQSVGGGGGNGGYAISVAIGYGGSLAVGMGGDGAAGGDGKTVTVSSGDSIRTEGKDAHGIFAQSVGGGGGSGGFSIAASAGTGVSGSLSMGGDGGAGGDGGLVSVTSSGNIVTGIADRDAIGVERLEGIDPGIAQLLSSNGFGTIAELAAASAADVGAIPGIGGVANITVEVLLDQARLQMQRGDHAYGILAQSVGGGGGDGGFSIAGALGTGGAVAFSMGGGGGSAGSGGDVGLYSESNIATHGKDAHAIVAQSIGGGGGSGGFSVAGSLSGGVGAAASLGGAGGAGSLGGNVFVGDDGNPARPVRISGNISTAGDHAYGILAQSVGGGGGDGGFSVAGTLAKGAAAAFSMGGSGGAGGNAGTVEVYSASKVRTLGGDAHGIVAQSIGGGGGSGGFSVAGSLTGSNGGAASIGGSGKAGGNGGFVMLDNAGVIETGIAGKGIVALDELANTDAAVIGLLRSNGFDTIAKVAAAGEEALLTIEGVDQATAAAVLHEASLFMQQDSHSYGILAQSVGGGGGDGGFSIAGTFSKGNSATFSMGGSGGAGGTGENVEVLNGGSIVTHGQNSYGILAQSIGGGGGSGGFSVAGSISLGQNAKGLNVSLGGSGGSGGDSGRVDVTNEGIVTTEGWKSHGIYALSLGGGGGIGGFSATGSLTPNTASKQLGVSVGGFGGAGGDAEAVTVNNNGAVVTRGERANAIYAQSIGGGGGDGGLSFSGSFSGQEAKQMSASVGGFGGGGGDGRSVDVNNSGTVETFDNFANGIYAQSVGGGGGDGGMSVTTTFGVTGRKSNYNLSLSLGGFGGDGGTGGDVTVNNCVLNAQGACLDNADDRVDIVTHGNDSYGIYAQSIGGGGGDGGSSFAGTISIDAEQDGKSNNLAVAVGGFGGSGNSAGEVEVNNNGIIDTSGNESHAIYAHSIGGGGGNGGSARTLSLVLGLTDEEKQALEEEEADDSDQKKKGDKSNKSLEVAVGGSGGEGGTGGAVTVANDGKLVTRGADAHGIFAQSVGGGGGTGGNGAHGVPDDLPIPEIIDGKLREQLDERDKLEFKEKLDIVVGGNGGFGNDAARVTIAQAGDIATLNNGSYGILAQSIGAGGGVGGNGAIGKDGKVGIGGGGGAAGDGGEVSIDMDGDIDTVGVSAHGIFAQSIGGGGGIAGNLDFGVVDLQEDILDKIGLPDPPGMLDAKINNIGIGIGWGRDGGAAGHGGKLTLSSDGDITTRGDAAYGIFAQSVGGGGGLAGNNGFGLAGELLNKASCIFECNALAGSAGGEGSGGEIEITHSGTITTYGDVSHGIFAQSAGGVTEQGESTSQTTLVDDQDIEDKDGNSIFKLTEGLFLPDTGDLGLGDVVSDITGQMRESFSGFIDNYLQAGTTPIELVDVGKDVSIAVSGDVLVYGANSHAIFAQSIGGDGNGDIRIEIQGGTVQGGTGSGAAIRFKDGADNTLVNAGTLTSINGVAGNAVIGGDGNETIHNNGTVTGIVNLGAGTNAFNNNAGARFDAGASIALGSGVSTGRLTNHGTLSPGGEGQTMTTAVTGDLVQTDSGRYLVDLDMSDYRIDLLDISGTGSFDGTARLGVLHPEHIRPGTYRLPIASAAAGIADEGIKLEFQPSAVSEYQLVLDESNNQDLLIEITTDFAPGDSSRLSKNQRVIGEYINGIQKHGGSKAFAGVANLLVAQPDYDSLAKAYEHLSPAPLLSVETVGVNSSLNFNEAMLSCRQRNDPHRFVREGECDWIQMGGRRFDRDSSSTASGFRENALEISGGIQRRYSENWHRGFALSYEQSNLNLDDNLGDSNGDRFQVGAMLKGNFGATTFSSGLTLGYGTYDTDRNTGLPEPNSVATSDQSLSSLALHLRLAHIWTEGDRYIRPMIDGGLSYVRYDSFNESGAGGANLRVRSHEETYPSIQPALEIGSEYKLDDGTLLRPYMKLGVTYFFDDTVPEITASFEGAPEQTGTFTVEGETDKTYGSLTLGLDALKTDNSVVRLYYNGQFSDQVSGHALAVKYSWSF